ncbi:MAG: NAD-dependent epimerase/dehydratase family protein [Pseudonocardiaceae bacterium]
MFVVGGRGYVGSEVISLAGNDAVVVSRDGADGSMSWQRLLAELPTALSPVIVWLLDGAKHDELRHLDSLIEVLPDDSHVVYVSTCTVYGNTGGALCDEGATLSLLAPHARLKASGEAALNDAAIGAAVLRLGALYGADPRVIRKDRIETWLVEARDHRRVTVPDATHWRGWLHRDQAARALHAAAETRALGVFNVATANATFAGAVTPAAELFNAQIMDADLVDPLSYRIDASKARREGLLTTFPSEDLTACTRAFAAQRWPGVVPRVDGSA